MNRLIKHSCIVAALALLAAPLTTIAQERKVAAPEKKPEAGLLLPAVQKAQEPGQAQEQPRPDGEGVMPHYNEGPPRHDPQRGIEPDEIDAKARASSPAPRPTTRELDKASPLLMKSSGGGGGAGKVSVREMMVKLQPSARPASSHRRIEPITVQKDGGGAAPTSVQARPAEPPKYEIADCGTPSSPMICCHHEKGDGSSCNLFKILCGNAGGTAQGDGESAACSDW